MKWAYQGSEIGDRPGTFSEGAVAMQKVAFFWSEWDRQERHTIEKLTKTMVFEVKEVKLRWGKVMLKDGFCMDSPVSSAPPYMSYWQNQILWVWPTGKENVTVLRKALNASPEIRLEFLQWKNWLQFLGVCSYLERGVSFSVLWHLFLQYGFLSPPETGLSGLLNC